MLYLVSFESSGMCGLIEAGYCLALQTNHCLHIHLSIYYSKVILIFIATFCECSSFGFTKEKFV